MQPNNIGHAFAKPPVTFSEIRTMPTIGKDVEELRIWDDSGTYRVIYTARLQEIIYVLHAFQKKLKPHPKKILISLKQDGLI